jgi:hypothetical protein
MKAEEIKLAFKKRQEEVKIEMANIADTLSGDLGKGDSLVVNARKNIQNIVEGYSSAIQVYQQVASTGEKYMTMAQALGDDNMISRLKKVIKDANDMIKVSNQAIARAKSI